MITYIYFLLIYFVCVKHKFINYSKVLFYAIELTLLGFLTNNIDLI